MFDDTTQRDAKLPDMCCAWDNFALANDVARTFYRTWAEYVMDLRPCQHSDRHRPEWGWLELRSLTLRVTR